MNKLTDTQLIQEIESRFGAIVAKSILETYKKHRANSEDLECMEVLQISEISCNYRASIKDLITKHRNLEIRERMLNDELETIRFEQSNLKSQIKRTYAVYRSSYEGFIYMSKCYLRKLSRKGEKKPDTQNPISNHSNTRILHSLLESKSPTPYAFHLRDEYQEFPTAA